MTKSAYDDEALDKIHIQSRLENMLHPEREGASEREFGMMEVMDDDEHLSRLRNIATESIFIDLLNTDEFLKKQDPEAVLEAYNDIIEVNPSIRGKKMALRQALREYMATESLDLATIGQLEKMENDSATRRDAKEKTMAEQASRFAQTQQKREQDVRELELKKKDMEMRESEARERVREFEKEMQRKKKEMKARKKEFEELKEERAEQFKYQKEHDTIRDELAAKQFEHQQNQDTTRNELASQQFEHQKEQDKTRNDLASEQFKHQKEQDSTKNKLEEAKLKNQADIDKFDMQLRQIAERAREVEALLGLEEKAKSTAATLSQKDKELALKQQEVYVNLAEVFSKLKDEEAARLALMLDSETSPVVREFLKSDAISAGVVSQHTSAASPFRNGAPATYVSPLDSLTGANGVRSATGGTSPASLTDVLNLAGPKTTSVSQTKYDFNPPNAATTVGQSSINPDDITNLTVPPLKTSI